jgi:hypothetical protein
MSDRLAMSFARVLLTAALATGVAEVLPAQALRGTELISVYRARRDTLTSWLSRTERRSSLSVDSMRKAFSTAVTRGSITVQTAPAYTEVVAVALMRIDSMLARSPLGGDARNPVTFRLHPHWQRFEYREGGMRMWMLDLLGADGTESGAEWWQSEGEAPHENNIAAALQGNERSRRMKLLPPALTSWLDGPLHDLDTEDRWVTTYTSLATSPTTIATACLVGNLGACKEVLLLESPRDRLLAWFTPSARRTLVQPYTDEKRGVRRRVDSLMAGALTACVDGSDDAACIRILRDYVGVAGWGDPMRSPAGRESLINAAVRMPGAPGLVAVMGRPDRNVVAALEAMSGKPLDEVLHSWIDQVRRAEPDRVQLPSHRVLSATFWIFAFGALALRGTRWRSR